MEGFILYNNEQDAEALINRLELEYLPLGNITNKYADVIISNNPDYQGGRFAVRIIEMVYESLTEDEKANLVDSLPEGFYLMEDII